MNALINLAAVTGRESKPSQVTKLQHTSPVRRSVLAARLILTLLALACLLPTARGATLVHDFYLPMPEAQIRQTFVTLETNVNSTLDSVFSVVVTGSGTVIYYDQWEDGYETDLANPLQSTTKVWGDGINANGIPPGFTNDVVGLPSGAVLALRNLVPLPRNPSTLLYDARDRMAATKALVVSRAAWATTPGPVLSGAVEVTATLDYGTSYISPVGQNLTNRLFQYVGFMIMAAEDNTSIAIDLDGPGTNVASVVVLNRGESHLVNSGVRTGGSVTSTKPVQVNLVIGRYAGRYATDWFTLYPTNQWSDSYYTPVGTAANGNQTFNYFYNPNSTNITINYLTRVGSGSFSVPASGVTQYQMPQNSGARFTSVGGANFFGLATVGANPSSDTAYDWGFSFLPADGLTTEAVVGWGPGSSDGSVNGSPVWVTPVAAARVYVDYNGDRNGALTDPNGNKYDVHYDLAALQSKTVFDPDKDQTAMRLYTVDGTVISTAWGEDPAVAGAGNPYFDFGTTVLPFPVPVLSKTAVITNDVGTPGLSIGDTLEYTIALDNRGLLPLGNTVVIDVLPTNLLSYVTNSTTFNGSPVADGVSGTRFPLDDAGYTIPIILRGGTSTFKFRAVAFTSGGINITNVASAVGYSLVANSVITPPPGGGSTQCGLNFANAAGTTVVSYVANTNIYVRLTDADANTSASSAQSVSVVVRNLTGGDIETITLTETGNNTGIFQSSSPLPSSVSSGLFQQDGTLNAVPGDILNVAYTDPVYADTCSGTAVIQVPALTKVLYLSGTNSPDQNLDRIDPVATADGTTAQTAILSGGTPATITTDAFTSIPTTSQTNTFTHTIGSGANRLLLVSASYDRDGGTIASVTYNGLALTNVVNVDNTSGSTKPRADIWQLVNPPTGTFNVVVIFSGASGIDAVVGAASFAGVDQSTPTYASSTNIGNSSIPTVTVAAAAGDLVFDTMALANSATATAGAGQTARWTTNTASIRGAASTEAGAASVTMSWTNTSARWATAALAIRPASVGGGSNTVSFTQSPAFCANFAMPSNSVVSVTNYVAVTSGSLPASPAVTATLLHGSGTVVHLTNAAYNSASNWIVWTGPLSSNITATAGQAFTLAVSNNQPGASFRIDYDSATKPSKIALPTTTVINVDNFAVFDAPYPGGSVVTAPTAGSLLYVRATVSDPFGAYDITSLGLTIDGAGTADDISTTLNDTSVVASDTCSKTYEFIWQTGASPGGFNLSATANEGTEGINDTATTSITLTFLDLGTPSTTTFTSGDNGTATNAFPANTNLCVRVNDSDQNTNSATIDLVNVTVTSGSGDSESLTLTETSTNSGVFTACIPASTSGGSGTNNGTLNAPAGTVLNVDYTDPNDPSDISSASGTVLTPPGVPGIAVSKTLVSPADGQAGVGEGLEFSIQVINTGSTTLTNVAVNDTFPAANFTFTSASVTPDVIGAGTLSWTNLGIFTPGQSVTLTVNFTASAVAASAINSATATGPGATNSDTAAVSITRSALTVTKSLLNPTNGPVPIGSNITYRITVQNSGTVAIPTLPLEDTFSAAQLQFVSATVAPDGSGAGSLLWNDITGAGSLAASNSITIDVTMEVVGSGEPSLNTAKVDYAVDANGDPVPSASGSVGITTGAARITGNVYNDADQSGTLTGGDTGLSGVTLELYSDPNADGNPADGTLLRLVTTGAAGDYELLNLATGAFVVVETDLPGYASSFPANNRLALNITGLTTNAGQNFFDYIPVVTNYATISGKVWLDTNANATIDVGEPGLAGVTVELVQDVNTNGLADLGEPTVDGVTTDGSGNYTFFTVVPGSYVAVETDLFGHVSTADSQGANDNQIGLAVGDGAVATNNYFLDYFTGNFPGNDAPVATNDTYTVNEDTVLNIAASGVLTNDTDVDGDVLTAVIVATTTNGSLTLNANGSFTYTPNTNFVGVDTFTYRASDGTTNSGVATVTITVTAVNDPPVIVPDIITITEDSTSSIPVLVNDSDSDGDPITITSVTTTNGTANVVGTNVVYTPSPNFNGTNTLTYCATDGLATNCASITVIVTPVNDAPIANNQNAGTPEDTLLNVVVTGTDVDSTNLVYSILAGPLNGTLGALNPSSGAVTYLPSTNYTGPDVFTFTVSDGSLLSTGTVSIIVGGINDNPLIVPDLATVNEDSTSNSVHVLVNDFDIDGDPISIVSVTTTNGTAFISGTNVVYTPSANFNGTNVMTYCATDGLDTNCASITVTVLPVNDAPVANNQSVSTPEDTLLNVVVSGSDIDSANLVYSILTGPANGSLGALDSNSGAVTYLPSTNYIGADSFTFTVFDGSMLSTGTVSITVSPINDAPVANNQSVTTPEDTSTNLVLTASDVDNTNLVFAILTSPGNGSLGTLNINSGAVTYSPSNNFNGSDSFTFTVTDGSLVSTGTVAITVTPVNDGPVVVNDIITVTEDSTNTIPVLVNDNDPDGDPLTLVNVSTTNGTANVVGTNVVYTPSPNFNGTNTLTYCATDGLVTNCASITVIVTPVNDAPIANNQNVGTPEDTLLNVVVTGTDVDSTNLVYSILAGPLNGTLGALNPSSGAVTYLPSTNYVGPDSFTFTVSDGSLLSTGTVSITVGGINDNPLIVADLATVNEDSIGNIIPVLVNDSDIDGDPITLVSVSTTNGTATIVGTNVVYTPSANFNGTNVMTYCATDGLMTNCATITVTVLPVNDAPVANNQSVTTPEDTSTNLVLTASDVDSSSLVFSILSNPGNGSLGTLDSNSGAVTYTPASNYFGADSFTFTVFDGSLLSTGTVSITVTPVNDAPVANNDNFTAQQNISTFFPASGVLANDTDPENNTLTAVIVSTPTNGVVGLNSDGGFIYTSTNNFTGTDTFTYLANDGTNNSAPATVSILVTPLADVAVMKSGLTNVNPGQTFTYTINVTNYGPSAASNVVVFDQLPSNVVFSNASAGGTISNSLVTWPTLASLAKNAGTNFTISVIAPTNGSFLNIASATSITADPNASNNDGSAIASRVSSLVVPIAFGIRTGTNVFNPQTGLYEQTVSVTNLSGSTVAAFQLLVGDIRSTNGVPRTNVWLWNYTGTNFDGRRYVQYNAPLDPGSNATVRLEFYNPARTPFTNSLEVQATLPIPATTNLSGGVAIDVAFADNHIPGEPRFVIEWTSVPGGNYTVIYGPTVNGPWTAATPTVTANATRTQWYDDGPPKTASKPLSGGSRFYRVILNNP